MEQVEEGIQRQELARLYHELKGPDPPPWTVKSYLMYGLVLIVMFTTAVGLLVVQAGPLLALMFSLEYGIRHYSSYFPVAVVQAGFMLVIFAAGHSMYFVRCRWPRWYGVIEIAVGLGLGCVVVNQIVGTALEIAVATAYFTVAGAIYVIVRGYDNIYRSLPKDARTSHLRWPAMQRVAAGGWPQAGGRRRVAAGGWPQAGGRRRMACSPAAHCSVLDCVVSPAQRREPYQPPTTHLLVQQVYARKKPIAGGRATPAPNACRPRPRAFFFARTDLEMTRLIRPWRPQSRRFLRAFAPARCRSLAVPPACRAAPPTTGATRMPISAAVGTPPWAAAASGCATRRWSGR